MNSKKMALSLLTRPVAPISVHKPIRAPNSTVFCPSATKAPTSGGSPAGPVDRPHRAQHHRQQEEDRQPALLQFEERPLARLRLRAREELANRRNRSGHDESVYAPAPRRGFYSARLVSHARAGASVWP